MAMTFSTLSSKVRSELSNKTASGAGFKGCCMALIDPAYEASITASVSEAYLKRFPHLEGKYQAAVCGDADGVSL